MGGIGMRKTRGARREAGPQGGTGAEAGWERPARLDP